MKKIMEILRGDWKLRWVLLVYVLLFVLSFGMGAGAIAIFA